MAQLVVQLTCIQDVAGSSPGDEQISFLNINTFASTFFFNNTVASHYKHASKRDLK